MHPSVILNCFMSQPGISLIFAYKKTNTFDLFELEIYVFAILLHKVIFTWISFCHTDKTYIYRKVTCSSLLI